MSLYKYNPNPARVWSRTQAACTFYAETTNYNAIYVALTKKTVSHAQALYDAQMLVKGNVLQYKKNSSNLTKTQRYSQICKGKWTNRTTSFATQTQTYTNPNTKSLKRVNAVNIHPNDIPGLPNNISGPYQTNVTNPFLCPGDSIQDGGNLICNTIVNPCSNEIIKQTTSTLCFPTTCSDVPGKIIDLCWDPRIAPWYAKTRTTMSNSGTKWPQNYKGLVGACHSSDSSDIIYGGTTGAGTNEESGSESDDENMTLMCTQKLIKLYTNVGADLAYFINKYAQDLMADLENEFTYEAYQNLVCTLFDLTYPNCPGYANIHTVITKALEMLWKSVLTTNSQSQLIAQLEATITELMNANKSVFLIEKSMSTVALIRPEIQIYIDRYGFPAGCVFDTTKLGEILHELQC